MIGHTPRPLEVAIGFAFGPASDAPWSEPDGRSPREALEDVVLAALQRAPCGVSFSGGRDSSLVLAVASEVARREGLPLPVPMTHRFPLEPLSDESSWQEMVVGALGLPDWQRLTWRHEMDHIGPIAASVLRRVGLLDPFNSFFHEPLCAAVAGGALLTGIGGDEVLGAAAPPAAFRIRYRRRRPRMRQLPGLAFSYAPVRVRARSLARRHVLGHATWLHDGVRRDAERQLSRWDAGNPLAWDLSLRRWWCSRECQVGLAGLDVLASKHDVVITHPLSSAGFLVSMANAYGHGGPGSRTRATAELAGDLLPEALVARDDKAAFGRAFDNGAASRFAQVWSGRGVDDRLVDVDSLRRHWQDPAGPHADSILLLQQAWLADDQVGVS